MEIVIRAAAAAVIGSILALLLRKYTPELSLTVTILAGVIIVSKAENYAFAQTNTQIISTMTAGSCFQMYFREVEYE